MMYSATIDRVPVFRDSRLSGFEYRTETTPAARPEGGDLAAAVHALPWFNTDRVDVTMEHGVVHLDGHVDSIHTVLALRRLAAAMPETAAIESGWTASKRNGGAGNAECVTARASLGWSGSAGSRFEAVRVWVRSKKALDVNNGNVCEGRSRAERSGADAAAIG